LNPIGIKFIDVQTNGIYEYLKSEIRRKNFTGTPLKVQFNPWENQNMSRIDLFFYHFGLSFDTKTMFRKINII